ncbi:dihydrodipicolinate synthase family protein [Tichowtungia aerotolerans]|uniref:Dihydrodipicolinate synthase family protein n=1 Tax=Tichowtungia aerotolerans TaxID=2697043 RepID=A0A6P1MAD3_9BACT|nr:dihydrodipicolinate synthase family protein [Tichowtungia aerotolerans]
MKGIVPPMVTPLKSQDELDVEGLERLVEHIIKGGVSGLFLLGTTGEGPGLSYALRRELLERTCKLVNGRVPVLACVTDTSFTESVHLAQVAADCGCHAAVLSAPYYFVPDSPELIEYVAHITSQIPLPLYLYNMPGLTKVNFSMDVLKAAMDMPGIVGLKDSSCSMLYFHQVRALIGERDDFGLLVGPEEMLAETVLLGGDGGVNGGANLFPRLYVELYKAAENKDMERISRLQKEVLAVAHSLYTVGSHPSSLIKGLKCALSLEGICSDVVAEPFQSFRSKEREQVASLLGDLKGKIDTALN